MSDQVPPPTQHRLPPIPLDQLKEKTKDLIIGLASACGCTPDEAVKMILDHQAAPTPPPAANSAPEAQTAAMAA